MILKPIFRWTIGRPSRVGFHIFEESVIQTINALGRDNFDWFVCYNNLTEAQLDRLREVAKIHLLTLYEQKICDCPLSQENLGTLWKLCPARIRIESYEIIMDNDVVICKHLPEIDDFLGGKRCLCLDEPTRYFGRYSCYLPKTKKYNSGLIGLVPGHDFQKDICRVWRKYGELENLNSADEQGLLALVFLHKDQITISKDKILELHPNEIHLDSKVCCSYKNFNMNNFDGYHFVESNRNQFHRGWNYYNLIKSNRISRYNKPLF
ncbi:MAG: hypothetical protein M0R80_01765 [Proteobacteria bacterium]|jgi:hypothetical protein|nr:hypothetical protein [Pseudomonadota bacterium]